MRRCTIFWIAGLAALPLAFNLPFTRVSAEPQLQTSGKTTLAVLPFVSGDAAAKDLAERMRFAVSQKLSRGGNFDRVDNVQVDQTVSALQIPWDQPPSEDDLTRVIKTLNTDETIFGQVQGRTLTLKLYKGTSLAKTATQEIPPDSQSPKLAVEHVLNQLTGTTFAHIRETQVDHSNPAIEAAFKSRPNLVPDAGFESAPHAGTKEANHWTAILGPNHYAPPVLNLKSLEGVPDDSVAVVPAASAGEPGSGHCLLMRMSKVVAESNGLACESDWIPVENGKTYRFTVRYRSDGPTTHIFLKGFADLPDEYSKKDDPETYRREFYRAQVLPTGKSDGWQTMEMDFTPSAIKPDKKITFLRVDLYVYLSAGDILFDDVVLKKLSP